MKNTYKQKRSQGFTIIEVMIVLAIAAVILLIVLLAVPALQRGSRNTQRKNDVSKILASVNTYSANHNGQLPGSNVSFIAAFPDTPALNIYDTTANSGKNQSWTYNTTAPGSLPADPANVDLVVVATYMVCKPDGTGPQAGGGSRSIVAIYDVETNGSPQEQCQTG